MKTIKVKSCLDIPKNYTGIAEYSSGTKEWYKDGKYHREGGPACEYSSGTKEWYLGDINYRQVDLKEYVVLDHNNGKYNIKWYKLLDKNKIFEYPDIPGLIIK